MKKCYICGGKLKKENIDIARYFGNDLIALNNVPTLICQKCGERYFEAKVSSKIDEKIEEVVNKKNFVQKINVPVVQFS